MANSIELNNKRIAKNTLMLYIRLFLTMAVGLYTSRIILQVLGVSDYGVYNLVGGFVAMLAYLNSAFVSATQRFISYSLGKDNLEDLITVFYTSKIVHYALALLVVIVAETFGVWFIGHKLNIEPGRMYAAYWVFHCSVLSMVVNIISVPYNSCIVAHEHMQVYAYVSILESLLKLLIVFLIQISPYDILISYAVLTVIVATLIRLCYTFYCKKHFDECRVNSIFNWYRFKEMLSYTGWVLIGNIGFTFKDQIANIILNGFYGTSVNAAKGIANQASAMINTFARNFFSAMSPQITIQYASGNVENSKMLVYQGAKYSFYMLGLIVIPVIINMNYILTLWLGDVPEYTCTFLMISLIAALVGSFATSLVTAIQATGNMKVFQLGISVIMLSELPFLYLFLYNDYPLIYALLPTIVTNALGVLFRIIVLKKLIPQYDLKFFFFNIIMKSVVVFLVALGFSFFICWRFEPTFVNLLLTSFLSISILLILIYCFGISKNERLMVNTLIVKLLHRDFRNIK